jgi:uncharacterized protein (DUF362 family)
LNPSVVSVQKISEGDIPAALEKLLLPVLNSHEIKGKSVLIKPNLVEPLPYTSGQTTNPALVEAVVEWCRKCGAADIVIGEGPSYFQPDYALRDCFTKTGMSEVAERQAVKWILFDEGSFREFNYYSPATPSSFSISEYAFSRDLIINIPVPKMHYLTGVSIAMKNLKGFVKREDKPSFHYCGKDNIHGSVTALNCMIRPFINIVDCTAPVHRNKSFILAGKDIVATDTVVASLMGINPETIKTIKLGHEAGLGEMDVTKINLEGEDVKDLHMNLEQPKDYLKRVFENLTLSADTACSGCLIPLFSSLRRMDKEDILTDEKIEFVLGKELPCDAESKILFLGQCTLGCCGAKPWLKGCPPTKEEMFEFIKRQLIAK